jgi:hypothetical protein
MIDDIRGGVLNSRKRDETKRQGKQGREREMYEWSNPGTWQEKDRSNVCLAQMVAACKLACE